ncbi:MAG: cyclic nucleotide-binding domain-containing protein [Myxococcales bacterium]|nr:cyclic nucleotide-binding domain-containing protein [Myxococcales bacterium]
MRRAPPLADPTAHSLDGALLDALDPAARVAVAARLRRLEVPDGAVVVREGDGDRTMYVILDGVAEARRGDVTLARLLPGQHFGELGMIGGGPRAASVVAVTPLVLGVLTRDAYRELAAADPTAALWLLEAVVSGLGVRLTEVTDSVGALLTERSLPRRTQIRVRIGDESARCRPG